MKPLFFCILIFSFISVQAQKYSSNQEQEKNYYAANKLVYVIYSIEYKEGKKKIEEFIRIKNFTIINQNETKDSYHYELKAHEKEIAAIDSFCNILGYVSSKNLNSYNNETKLFETKLELERLEIKKSEYEKMLIKIDSVKSTTYYQHWEKIRDIETEIYNTKKKIGQLESVKYIYEVTIDLNDEQTSPTSSKVNFVKMPGAEYVNLFTENAKDGISYENYQGISMKFLFTKGKSYFSAGALKAINPSKEDSLAIEEMFGFTFGQDWYSRHLGRGYRRFFNLYIGYQIGISVAYNRDSIKWIPFICPGTGVELFKNKFLLIDTDLSYFLPVSTENRNLRGWKVGASFNFTF